MNFKTLFIMITAAILMSCVNSFENDVQGIWSIRSVTLNKNETPSSDVQLAAFGWLNIHSTDSKIQLNEKNEIFIDNKKYGAYRVAKDKIFILDSEQHSHEGTIVLSSDGEKMEMLFEKNIKISLSKN
jgi:hypothetical protein